MSCCAEGAVKVFGNYVLEWLAGVGVLEQESNDFLDEAIHALAFLLEVGDKGLV